MHRLVRGLPLARRRFQIQRSFVQRSGNFLLNPILRGTCIPYSRRCDKRIPSTNELWHMAIYIRQDPGFPDIGTDGMCGPLSLGFKLTRLWSIVCCDWAVVAVPACAVTNVRA